MASEPTLVAADATTSPGGRKPPHSAERTHSRLSRIKNGRISSHYAGGCVHATTFNQAESLSTDRAGGSGASHTCGSGTPVSEFQRQARLASATLRLSLQVDMRVSVSRATLVSSKSIPRQLTLRGLRQAKRELAGPFYVTGDDGEPCACGCHESRPHGELCIVCKARLCREVHS